jgi:hypothetical protein
MAAAIGAFTAAPLFDALGAGPAWLIAGVTMAALLSLSSVLDRPRRRISLPRAVPAGHDRDSGEPAVTLP